MAVSSRIDSAIRHRSAGERAVELAERQFGRIARWQLLACGLSASGVQRWLRASRLFPIHPGVYALGHRATQGLGGRLAAAVLYAGPGTALSSITALSWWEIIGWVPEHIHVDAPTRRSSRQDVVVHHPRRVERVWHRGLPIVPASAALVDSARHIGFVQLRKALAEAEYRHLLDLDALPAALGKGRHGSATARAALDAHMPQLARTQNDFEADFLFLLERFRLPLPEVNVRVGPFKPDMLWRDRRLIVELDGREAHTSPAQVRTGP